MGNELEELRLSLERTVVDVVADQTRALSGEIEVNRELLRKNAAAALANGHAVTKLNEAVFGTEKEEGLVAKQERDDEAWKYAKTAKRLGYGLGVALLTIAGWWYADHVQINENRHAIEAVKTRVEHVEELREQADEHHRELLDALRRRE